jgi:acylphosphatase
MVSGEVQGVFFRAECRAEAARTGVHGWVRNASDGRVEAVFEGPADAVDHMVRWCWDGPTRARVTHVEVSAEPAVGETRFSVR